EPDQVWRTAPESATTPNNTAPGRPRMTRWSISVHRPCSARAKSIPVSSNKSKVGHILSAAGTVESLLTLHQRVPPTINYNLSDPAIPLDVVPNVARDAKVRHPRRQNLISAVDRRQMVRAHRVLLVV